MGLLATLLILAALLAAVSALVARGQHTEAPCRVTYVYDGDTVAMICGAGEVTARLMGFDTPEAKDPRCPAEKRHADAATARLRDLVAQGPVRLRQEGHDKYGRALVRMWIDGADVARLMVAEGLAVTYRGGRRPDWCARLGAT